MITYGPNTKTWIQTQSGKRFNYLEPRQEDICIADIACGLSNICRFSGQVGDRFYSVAEHSVLCSMLVPHEYDLAALMHDAAEAYCVDVPNPLKIAMRSYADAQQSHYDAIEESVHACVRDKYRIKWDSDTEIHVARADRYAFLLEADILFGEHCENWPGWDGGECEKAKRIILDKFNYDGYCHWKSTFGLSPSRARQYFLGSANYILAGL